MKSENTSTRLKQILKERNLKQVDVLELAKPYCKKYNIKLGKTDLSQYVSGKVEPGSDKLGILGHALNVSETWLMGYDVPMERKEASTDKTPLLKIPSPINLDDRIRREQYNTLDAYGRRASDVIYDALNKLMAVEQQRIKDSEQETFNIYANDKLTEWPVPLYDIKVSAGTGQFLDSEHYDVIWLKNEPPRGTTFMVQVSGDSMEPQIHDGDRLFVCQQPEVREQEVGVFFLDGDVFVKEFWTDSLSSFNPAYDDIDLSDYETVRCYGRVLGVCKE